MSGWQIFFAVIGVLIGVTGLMMALARTPPTDAVSNLSKWVEWAGIGHIPIWLRNPDVDRKASRWSRITLAALIVISAFGTVFYFQEYFGNYVLDCTWRIR